MNIHQVVAIESKFEMMVFLQKYWITIIGFFSLALPTIWSLSNTIWRTDDQAHGPIVLLMALWIFWEKRNTLNSIGDKYSKFGWVIIVIGLFLYFSGRIQEIWLFEVGSFIFLISGLIFIFKSTRGLKVMAFPLFFLLFTIPLPGFIVDPLTSSLKQHISDIAETLLYMMNYPVARNGVTLVIGQYQLLVADACSGLHSMFSLYALGLFYIYIQAYKDKLRNLVIFLIIAPIAFLANIIRVITLVVVTYYFGEDVGQGFIHGAAGFFLFGLSLLVLWSLDVLIGVFFLISTIERKRNYNAR